MRRLCSPPNSWRNAGLSASPLLVHEVAMLATTQTGIDRPPGEGPPLGTLARLAALDGRFQPPPRLVIVEDLRPAINATWPMISAMVSRSSRASSDSKPSRPAMKAAGPPQSSGGQAPLPLMQEGYAFPGSGCCRSSMRTSWRHGMFRSYS
jgi:hypothetical protein